MDTDSRRTEPVSITTRFGASLRIDEQWFEALSGKAGENAESE